MIIAIVLAVVVVLVLLWVLMAYNKLVRARNGFRNAFAQIDVQLQRRFDLIPNLVETAKAYMSHERETLEAVTSARAAAIAGLGAAQAAPGAPGAMQELAATQGALTSALGRFTVVAEAYPDLKASANMQQLSEELASTENRVAFSRQAYNDAVLTYNNTRETAPTNLIAGAFGFEPAALWEVDPGQPEIREAPRVQF